jgi:hypothetical protein
MGLDAILWLVACLPLQIPIKVRVWRHPVASTSNVRVFDKNLRAS